MKQFTSMTSTFLLLSLLLTSGASRGQQVTCSAVDPSTNTRSLPDVPVKDASVITATINMFTVLENTDLDIYTVPSTQTCSGTVLALEFCYSESNQDLFHTEEYALTLLTLSKSGSSFNVTDAIAVQSRPRQDDCSLYSFGGGFTVQYCCGRYNLEGQGLFSLPSAFAVTMYSPPPGTTRQLLAYNGPRYDHLRVTDFNSVIVRTEGVPMVGSIINAVTRERTLALFNLVIGPSSATPSTPYPNSVSSATTPPRSITDVTSEVPISHPSPTPNIPNPSPTTSISNVSASQPSQGRVDSTSSLWPMPTNLLQPAAIMNPQGEELSLGLIAGVAAGAGVAAMSVLLLFLFVIVAKWRSRKQGSSQDCYESGTRQPPNIEAVSFNHSLNESSNKNLEAEYDLNDSMQINYYKETHIQVGMMSTNDAYGIKQQDDDLYAHIDSLAPVDTLVCEADKHQSTTVFSNLAYGVSGNTHHHEYTDITDAIDSTGNRVAGCHAITRRGNVHGEVTDEEPQHDYTDIVMTDQGVSELTDRNVPDVLSSNLAYRAGTKEVCQHVYTDIAITRDGTLPRTASGISDAQGDVTTVSANQAYGVGKTKGGELYAYIPDTIDDSAHTHPNDAYGIQSDETTRADTFNRSSANNASTIPNEAYGIQSDVTTVNEAYGVSTANEEHYADITDTINSSAYRAAAGAGSTQRGISTNYGTMTKGSQEENQYDLIPAENHYDTVGPVTMN